MATHTANRNAYVKMLEEENRMLKDQNVMLCTSINVLRKFVFKFIQCELRIAETIKNDPNMQELLEFVKD